MSYRDKSTAQKFDRGASGQAQSREAFRGRAEAGRKDLSKGGADQFRDRSAGGKKDSQGRGDTGSLSRGEAQQRRDTSGFERTGTRQQTDKSVFGGHERGGQTRDFSSRGRESMSSSRSGGGSGMSRGGGGRGGGRSR